MRYVRRVTFINPANGESWQVLTNELTLPPGFIVKLYLMRREIEPERQRGQPAIHSLKQMPAKSV